MKLYTRTGDKGKTSLVGERTTKWDIRVEAYGTTDEANSWLGVVVAKIGDDSELQSLKNELLIIAHELFDCGGDLAQATTERRYQMQQESVTTLEKQTDVYTELCPPLERFILPGGHPVAADLHVLRTIVRRAERLTAQSFEQYHNNPLVLAYLNRLSDYLFAAARFVNMKKGCHDVEYDRGGKVFK
ncbi:MAG: cob(I)yrinic acid a,c-diamide adenosyltransferase [Bacilli bacterium]